MTLDHKSSRKVKFSKLRFIHHLKAEYISFPLMYGLLGYDYFEIHLFENLESDKINQNIEKIPLKLSK